MSQSIIQIQHLSKTFGGGPEAVHALEDINLDIRQGEIFGIIGLSGAGKSTLVRCMNLLERPTSGTVVVDGQNMTELSEKALRLARRKITMIFQSFNLLMQRTCLKNVCFPMEIAGVPKARARKRAEEEVFEPFLDACAGELPPSGLRSIEEACPPVARDYSDQRLELAGERQET